MTVREKRGDARGPTFFDKVAAGDELIVPTHTPDLRGDVELALESGCPVAALLLHGAGVNRETALAYEQLLADLFVAERVPPWSSNRLMRIAHRPKRYLIDPALIAAALRIDANGVVLDGDLLGRVCGVIGIEIKATAAPTSDDAKHLAWLREQIGDRFISGVVFHTGPRGTN
jgi:hypothetical protein